MSNRIALATIQFRADATGANAALDSMKQSAKDARRLITELQEALNNGIRTMKDANGVEFNVAEKLRQAKTEAKNFEQAIRELMKGATALESVVKNIRLGEIEASSRAELKGAINAAESRKRSVRGNDPESLQMQRELNIVIEESRKQLSNLDRDTEKIIQTINEGGNIAQSVLDKEQKGLREIMSMIPKGTEEWNKYNAQLSSIETHVAKIKQQELTQAASLLSSPGLGQHSEADIRKAIEAGKQLIQTYGSASNEARDLAQDIVLAEKHLEQYGLQAERTARKEAEATQKAAAERQKADQMMRDQLQQGVTLSDSALKAQEQYWQRLIDDPKTAASSLDEYRMRLSQVHDLQNQKMQDTGRWALMRFQNDPELEKTLSADRLKEYTEYLKKYRDSLPQDRYADVIRDIDDALRRCGDAAQQASGQLMSLEEALKVGAMAGTGQFKGTTEQLNRAKKTLEEMQQKATKGGKEWRVFQEYINNIELELRNVGHVSNEIQAVLDKPKGRSFNELKQAVEQGRRALNSMRTDTKEGKEAFEQLAKQVKEADFEMKKLGNSSKGTATAFEKAWSRLKTYIGLYMGAAVAIQKLTSTFGDIMELSDKMGEVRKTTNMAEEDVGKLSENLKKLDVRTSLTSLMELSASAGQLGLKSMEDIQGFTEAANKLMIALPEMGKEAATEMMRVAIATGEVSRIEKELRAGTIEGSSATAIAMEKIASTIDRLRASSASTAPEITDFVKRVGAVGAQSGIGIDQVAALGSTISSLGMRVEMSATALSRMIPAIKNNAFELAKAIGVTPEVIRNLFEAGRGMEAILIILQHMKDSGMDEDSIEKMMGMGGMADVMKDLNQQGARAGIVFAGLSQNVDELRRQLGVANQAYEENLAIQREFDKMNQTAAAQWERLKNQISEMFVGDQTQRILGGLIKGLRFLVDLIAGDNGLSSGIRKLVIAIAVFKVGLGEMVANGIQNIGKLSTSFKNLGKQIWSMGGLWNLIATAVIIVGTKILDFATRTKDASKAIGGLEGAIREAQETANNFFYSVNKTNNALAAAKTRLEEAKKANLDTADAERKLQKASADHAASIREINSKYGQYLGYMLSETSSAEQLARARELINAKLRETITLKQREAALGNIEQEYGSETNKKLTKLDDVISEWFKDPQQAAEIYTKIIAAVERFGRDAQGLRNEIDKKILPEGGYGRRRSGFLPSILAVAEDYRKQVEKMQKEQAAVNARFSAQEKENQKATRNATVNALSQTLKEWQGLVAKYQAATGDEKKKLALEVYKQQRAYTNLFNKNEDYFDGDQRKTLIENNIKNMKTYEKGLRSVAGEAIRSYDAMERAETKITGIDYTSGGESANNPWGTKQSAESTDYKDMTAEQLVQRRKQMRDFVNAIQTDTDVQSVLKEDAALKKAIEKGMSSDMRTVIEWYNTERLKIQDELHGRHLTNTGDWMDPKKQSARKKRLQEEWRYYLDELDAYYTERKSKIQEAQNEEGISEAEAWQRTIANEAEWRWRRSELQQLYADKSKEVAKDEQNAIFKIISERTGESTDLVEKTIGKTVGFMKKIGEKSPTELRRALGSLDKGIEQDLLKRQNAIAQQVKAIADIVNKERPFNGITENLQENLIKMGILTADMTDERNRLMAAGEDMAAFNDRQFVQEIRRISFLLGEAENAYQMTIDELLQHMHEKGFREWADAIAADENMKRGMMAMLHSTYDAVQDAIKKEASLIKKQVEIQWNFAPEGSRSLKQSYEAAVSALGLAGDQVGRANSLIGAGHASERVADKIAVKQMQVQLAMQEHYFNLVRKTGRQRIDDLKAAAKTARELGDAEKAERLELDAKHAARSLDLSLSEEQKKLDEQRVAIANRLEESQNRLYKELKEWADLLSASLKTLFEAGNTGQADYYNQLAKMRLTGEGAAGGTYVVIDNAGTENASAHYEYLQGEAGLLRQMEIDRQNAIADAWKKVADDVSEKMNSMLTDQMNAMLQNASVDANTDALTANTSALVRLSQAVANGLNVNMPSTGDGSGFAEFDENNPDTWPRAMRKRAGLGVDEHPHDHTQQADPAATAQAQIDASSAVTEAIEKDKQRQVEATSKGDKQIATSTQSAFAKMTQAANLYGITYQAMSNDNLSAAQKFEMIALQAAGNAAITMLTTDLAAGQAKNTVQMPGILGKLLGEMPYPAAIATFAIVSALMGGLMGLAVSKVAKSKAQIAAATGAGSTGAGRLATGMLTYAAGNVNEFTDPASLTPGRQYNVDAADGRTYRARYMGRNPRTHITNGPEFHLAGEKGREAIIDAKTTRQITMDDNGIWRAIQTLYNGGSVSRRKTLQRGRGVAAFADGNLDDFSVAGTDTGVGMGLEQLVALQTSIDRQNDLLERALADGIRGVFDVHGPKGLVNTYDTAKKEALRHGERYT